MRRHSPSTFARGTYGGFTDMPFTGTYVGGNPGFWRTGYQGAQWCLIDPEGYIFYASTIYAIKVDSAGHYDFFQDQIQADRAARRVGPVATWAPLQCQQMLQYGFTMVGEASVAVMPRDSAMVSSPHKLPAYELARPAFYCRGNEFNYLPGGIPGSIKDVIEGNATYMGSNVVAGRGIADFFDPNFAVYTNAMINPSTLDSPWYMGLSIDDADYMQGFGLGRDYPSSSFQTPTCHLGFVALQCKPKQVTGSDPVHGGTITYLDQTVYTKQALSTFLQTRYGTIGALNTAWGTSSYYTTFGQQGPGDTWGTGTGLLDEDGRHTAWIGTYVTAEGQPIGGNATINTDLDDFLYEFCKQFYSVVSTQSLAAHPNLLRMGPTTIGSHGGPPRSQVMKAAAEYCDIIQTGVGNADPVIFQAETDFMVASMEGNPKPLMTWTGRASNPDSAMRHEAPSNGIDEFRSMKERCYWYVNRVVERCTFIAASTDKNHQVGHSVWEYLDKTNEEYNYGVKTLTDAWYDQSLWSTVRPEFMGWTGACGYDMSTMPRCDPFGYVLYPENVSPGGMFGGDYGFAMARSLELVREQMAINLLEDPPFIALELSVQAADTSCVAHFGHASFTQDLSATVELLSVPGNVVLDTVVSSSGYANRTASFTGLTASTNYRIEVTVTGFAAQGQDFTTMAAGVGTATIGIYLRPSPLTPTADRVTIAYGTVTSGSLGSSVTQTGMASGGTVNLTLDHNELYRWNHTWKDSSGTAVSGTSNFSFLLVE